MISTFIGHQGASSTWPCIWKLIKLRQLGDMWKESRDTYASRTTEDIKKWAKIYDDKFGSLDEDAQKKANRSRVTQNDTYSIIYAMLADIPFDTILFAVLHVRLGFTKTLVNFVFDFFQCVEDNDGTLLGSVDAIEDQISKLGEYKKMLDSELEELLKAIEGQDTIIEGIMDRIDAANKVVTLPTASAAWRERYTRVLEQAQEQLRQPTIASMIERNKSIFRAIIHSLE